MSTKPTKPWHLTAWLLLSLALSSCNEPTSLAGSPAEFRLTIQGNQSGATPDGTVAARVETTPLEGDDGPHINHFLLELSRPLTTAASVSFQTRDGTATAGEDYMVSSGTATIPAGETSTEIGVEILGDTLPEDDETFQLAISNPQGGRFPAGVSEIAATHTIVDDDTEEPVTEAFLGTNLEPIVDYGSQMAFVDLFKISTGWLPQCQAFGDNADPGCTPQIFFNTRENVLDLDDNGWVRSLPAPEDPPIYTGVAAFWSMYPAFEGGRFIVLYEGEGALAYGQAAQRIDAESVPGREVIEIDISNTTRFSLIITSTDPQGTGNYIRNIRVIPEAFAENYEQHIFNPDYLDRIRPFHVLRFMHWMAGAVTGTVTGVSSWEDRTEVADARYSGPVNSSLENAYNYGLPVEIMVALSNTLDRDPWFTMPYRADDDFMRNFATLVRDNLNSQRNIYG